MAMSMILQGKEGGQHGAKRDADTVFEVIFVDDRGNPVTMSAGEYFDVLFYSSEERTDANFVANELISAVNASTGHGQLTVDKTLSRTLGLGSFWAYGRHSDGAGTVADVLIDNPGTNIVVHPTITLTTQPGDSGAGATATVNVGVNTATVNAGGSGYAVDDVIEHGDPGVSATTAAQFRVTTVSSGAVTGLAVIEPGEYTAIVAGDVTNTATTAISGAGTGCTINTLWSVVTTTVTAPGANYSLEPTVNITAGDDGALALSASITGVLRQISEVGSQITVS